MQPFSQKANYWPSQQAILSVALLLLAAFLFSGCSEIKPTEIGAPEDTAVSYVRELKLGNFVIDFNSVKAIQQVDVGNRVLVLVQYSGTRLRGGAESCEFVIETEKAQFFRWETRSGGGSCHEINDPVDTLPITVASSRSNATLQDPGYSTAYGVVRDPQTSKVVVTWEDELVQTVEVQENTYLAAREGGFSLKKIEAFNAQNATLYTTELGSSRKSDGKK